MSYMLLILLGILYLFDFIEFFYILQLTLVSGIVYPESGGATLVPSSHKRMSAK